MYLFPIFAIILSSINLIKSEECPTTPCLAEDKKPQLEPTSKLEVKLFYYTHVNDALQTLENNLCQVIKDFNGLISINYMMGALVKEENGELYCGVNGCDRDRFRACELKLDPAHFNICYTEGVSKVYAEGDLQKCIDNHESDEILKAHAKERRDLQIQDCQVPALVFNNTFDPCAKHGSYQEIKDYVCGLYKNAVDPCPKNN